MDVVTGAARHGGTCLKTPGATQQRHLIPVHVGDDVLAGRGRQEGVEAVAGTERERGPLLVARPRMTQRADVDLPIARGRAGIEDGVTGSVVGMGDLIRHMLASVAVT